MLLPSRFQESKSAAGERVDRQITVLDWRLFNRFCYVKLISTVDTPEKFQPGFLAAKARLQQLLASGNVEIRPVARDKFGRTVARVFVNGRDVAEILRVEGHAKS